VTAEPDKLGNEPFTSFEKKAEYVSMTKAIGSAREMDKWHFWAIMRPGRGLLADWYNYLCNAQATFRLR
jgi:hypothetical protein